MLSGEESAPGGLAGLLLAAGAGSRMGRPKALLCEDGVPRTALVTRDLVSAGCDRVTVVLGAAAESSQKLLAEHLEPAAPVETVLAEDWATGMGRSLAAGLARLAVATEPPGPGSARTVAAALVMLVDLPDVGAAVLARVVERWRSAGSASDALVRATYAGRPGHPVLLGRDHWPLLLAELRGDRGARDYLGRHTVREVSCEDLATGRDLDRPEDLPARRGAE